MTRKTTIVLLLIFILASCIKTNNGDSHRGKVMVIGHMGMGMFFNMPGNSFESVRTAISIGCDGSELDVQMTRDSVLVAFHDDDLGGMTFCGGRVPDQSWADISNCRYRISIQPASVCSVQEIFEKIPNIRDLYFSFDWKPDAYAADPDAYQYMYLRAVKRLCDQYQMGNHVFLEGPADLLDKAKSMGFKNKLFLFSNNDDDPVTKAAGKYDGITTNMYISAEDIRRAYDNKVLVMVWDPDNYAQNKQALDKQPDIIMTDDPVSILKLLKRYNYENVIP